MFSSGPTVIQVEREPVQAGGFALTLEVYLEDTSPTSVRGYQFALDDATGGSGGSVDYDPSSPPVLNDVRDDYIFIGAVGTTLASIDEGAPARLVRSSSRLKNPQIVATRVAQAIEDLRKLWNNSDATDARSGLRPPSATHFKRRLDKSPINDKASILDPLKGDFGQCFCHKPCAHLVEIGQRFGTMVASEAANGKSRVRRRLPRLVAKYEYRVIWVVIRYARR